MKKIVIGFYITFVLVTIASFFFITVELFQIDRKIGEGGEFSWIAATWQFIQILVVGFMVYLMVRSKKEIKILYLGSIIILGTVIVEKVYQFSKVRDYLDLAFFIFCITNVM